MTRVYAVALHLVLAAVAATCAGCWSVAASVAGGTLLGVGSYAASDTSRAIVRLPLDRTEALTRKILAELDIDIAEVARKKCEGVDTKCHFEAGLLGEEVIPIDVTLERLSRALTRVTVTVSRGVLKPELETAEEILARIVRAADKYSAWKRPSLAAPPSPLPVTVAQ